MHEHYQASAEKATAPYLESAYFLKMMFCSADALPHCIATFFAHSSILEASPSVHGAFSES